MPQRSSHDEVSLQRATATDTTLLSNLLQLYIHDLSEAFADVELGADGRFRYDKLPLYWSEPERHFPFLIRIGERVAGFVFATRGSPVSDDPDVLDIAEFFVMRRHRRGGVGRRAATLLWTALPGNWIVRALERNEGAVVFWRDVLAVYTEGKAKEHGALGWRIFSFETKA